jgi:DNA-binding MarR family transcriptional regulator
MIGKSNHTKRALLAAIGDRVQAYQDATDEVDEAVARLLDLNRTDLRCLSVLSRAGAVSASTLADATGLTRGAMTTALDRLEAAGYARRVGDDADRRSVRVELTDAARRDIWALYGPLAQEGAALLRKYTAGELAVVLRYLEEGEALQRAQAERIRARWEAASDTRAVRGSRTSRK